MNTTRQNINLLRKVFTMAILHSHQLIVLFPYLLFHIRDGRVELSIDPLQKLFATQGNLNIRDNAVVLQDTSVGRL